MAIDVDPEQDFHVVINGVATALSLDALAEAYEADSIGDDTLIWQAGLAEWMRLDALLVALAEQGGGEAPEAPEPATSVGPDNYSVAVAPDDIRSMTLQALADAHRRGLVRDETLVFGPGASEWVPLSVIIAGFAARASVAPGIASVAPGMDPALQNAAQRAPVPSSAPAPRTPASSVAPALAPTPSAVPSAPYSSAPYSSAPYSSAPHSLAPIAASLRPMAPPSGRSADLDFSLDDLDVQSLRSSRSPWVMRSLMGAGALAFALVIYLGAGDAGSEETAQAGPASPSGPSVARAPQVEEEVEPSAWEKEQAMLKEADRLDAAAQARAAAFGASLAGESKQEKASSSPAKRTWRPKAKKSTAAKSTGHSEYDPMNGTL